VIPHKNRKISFVTRSIPQRSRQKCVDTFLGRTHESARSRCLRKSTRRASQHGPV
jgi:hypothetical protein